MITHIYGEGQFFGHLSLLRDGVYDESAMAMEDSRIRLIPEEDFKLLLFNDKDFSAKFIKMIASETVDVEQQLLDLAYGSVRKKVANALLALASNQSQTNGDNSTIEVTRDDLSKLAGVAKETLIRTLSDFKSEGLIAIDGNFIKLLNHAALEDMPL